MFTPKYRIISGLVVLTLCTTCVSPDKQPSTGSKATADSDAGGSAASNGQLKNFLDSIQAKKGFTFSEISDHVNIDSIYYRNHVRFFGDTVWHRKSRHPLAVIRCSSGTINKKLLLVFNKRGDCTASLVVAMNGDVDAYDSVVLNYKILGSNSFSTTEVWTYRGGSKEDKITVTRQFYQVDKKGSILAQNNIIRSFTRPKVLTAIHRQ
jgi:hypothetical protein